ncbi:hypothetical protein KKH82_06755 [Patescibacteria group bacterium]|nr:hypothetical protein [Patescibacteria group bacterium]
MEYTSIFDYLKPMKERLDAAKTDVELNALLTEVQSLDQVDDSSAV